MSRQATMARMRAAAVLFRLVLCLVLLAACAMPGDAAPIAKIGLIAPFEGLGRPFGYAVLPAVKVAVDEANATAMFGRYRVALVALNDDGDPATAARQSKALALDPDVLAVVGPWSSETVAATAPNLASAGLVWVSGAPATGLSSGQRSLCPTPVEFANAMISRSERIISLDGDGGSPGVNPAQASRIDLAGPENVLAAVLRRAAGNRTGVDLTGSKASASLRLFTGDASQAADDLVAWRASGWQGRLVGGPDLARSWFIGRAGGRLAEGSLAAVCVPAGALPEGFAAAYRAAGGADVGPEAALAYVGARAVLDALATDVRSHGRPGRAGTAAALAAQPYVPRLAWLQVTGGRWTAADD